MYDTYRLFVCQQATMANSDTDARLLDQYTSRQKALAARLAAIGFIWPGSIQIQWIKCGKPGCACAHNPQARHGPYVHWTTKRNGRTVCRLLHSPETELLTEWVENRREMDRILSEMKQISQRALSVTLRMRRRNLKP